MKVEDHGEFNVAFGPGYQSIGSSSALRKSAVPHHDSVPVSSRQVGPGSVRRYEAALTKLGFTKLFSCESAECGVALTHRIYASLEASNLRVRNQH